MLDEPLTVEKQLSNAKRRLGDTNRELRLRRKQVRELKEKLAGLQSAADPSGELFRRLTDMEDEIAHWKAIAQEAQLGSDLDQIMSYPNPAGLTATETQIFYCILNRAGGASKERIHNAVYSNELEPPELKIVDVMVCKIRKKLADCPEFDAETEKIETIWGFGYRATSELRETIALLCGEEGLRPER